MSLSNPPLTPPLQKEGYNRMALAQQRNNVSLSRYSGRFAPSPTGPLHFGSLITAVASYCDAKANHGLWYVRIEDTDIPRIYPGSQAHILRAIDVFQFEPDSDIIFQKDRLSIYENVIQQLHQENKVYACQCTRKILGSNHIYTGTCQELALPFANQAIRVKVSDYEICFQDYIQGQHCSNLKADLGDFVLKRRDGIINYQLAVVVDDYLQGITHVVRGADLLDNTERQIWLGHVLNYPRLEYIHLPLAMNHQGQKLSKQNMAHPLDLTQPSELLQQALQSLKQPPVELNSPHKMLQQAIQQWDLNLIPKCIQLDGIYV